MESCLECRNENWHSISLVVYFSDRGLLVAHINFLDDSLWLWHLVCHVFMFYSKWLHEQTWHGNWTLILLVQKIWKGCFDPICGSLMLLLFLSSLVEKDLKLCFCSVYNEISRLFMFSFFLLELGFQSSSQLLNHCWWYWSFLESWTATLPQCLAQSCELDIVVEIRTRPTPRS